jgi:hypothetical protein
MPAIDDVKALYTEKAQEWGEQGDWEDQLRMARARATSAARCTKLVDQRRFAIEAAARLIDAADALGAMISVGLP